MTKQSGMTLLELTIATAILGVMLAGMTQFYINLVHQDRTAVSVQDSTQNVRYALDDISSQARQATQIYLTSNPVPPLAFSQLCLYSGNGMVEYFAIAPPAATHQILYKRVYSSTANLTALCPAISATDADDVAVTSNSDIASGDNTGINVADFQASLTGTLPNIQTLNVRLGMTNNLSDLQPGSTTQCTAGTEEFCSVTSFETSISLRDEVNTGP
jgi:prepilin-type N-terminal cleavage/methylation domain-containing protein